MTTPHDSMALSQLLSAQAGGRLPLSSALYACSEIARLVAGEHELNFTVSGLDADHIRCTRSGAIVLGGSRVHHPDTKADVFAVGALFYRLLTGYAPAAKDVAAPSSFNPGVDSELDAVILSALARDGAVRPASVRVLEGALAAVFEELELSPSPDDLAGLVSAVPVAAPAKPATVTSPPMKVAKPAPVTSPVAAVTKVPAVVAAPRPIIVPRSPPHSWLADDEEESTSMVTEVPSWQTQERERKWMVGITAAMIAVALLWVLWPAPKVNRASLDDTPVARVSARR